MDNTAVRPAPPRPDAVRLWAPAAVLAVAFFWLFSGTIANMTERWADPTFSHGWIVAPAAIAIAWYKRDTLIGTPVKSSLFGLVVILLGLLSLVAAVWTDVLFVPFLSMLIVLGGVILYFGGWQWFRKLAFPYAFLFFMVPWPDFLVETISFPMQLSTSAYAAALANMVGVHVVRDGVNLSIPAVKASFEVAVACSGMHSLVALLCLAAGFAYFTPDAMWKRWTLFFIGLPMALIANIVRVFLILLVANWISPDLAGKAFHDWSSPVLFVINTMGLMAVRNALMSHSWTLSLDTAGDPAHARTEDDDAF